MGLYEFKREDAERFARNQYAKTRVRGDEFQFERCPYCGGGESGKDRFTFSISLSTGQYKCLRSSCGAHGNFITLARDFSFSLGSDMDRYYSSRTEFRKFGQKEIKTKDKAVELMAARGISESVVKKYELTIADRIGENIIVFPFFDEKGILRFIKYRNMHFQKGVDKNKEWCESNCMPILFGMKQCNNRFDRLIITEGQIDSLSVADAGIENAVSVPTGAKGFTWVPYCWDWFSKFREIIVFGDCENGEITLLEELKKRFSKTIRAVQIADYRDCKDANEILVKHGRETLRKAVENAQAVPVKYVKEVADVKRVDIYSIPKILTGIKELDKLIGGFYQSQVIVLTGKRGDGKSTLLGGFIAEALDQGKNVFAYSGELQDYFFKRWIDMQIAGSKNMFQNERDGTKKSILPNSVVDRINDWYRGRFFIYDNNVIEDDEIEDLLQTIEKTIMQYGIDMICIDNLMTALDVGMDVDFYRAQSKFVNKLCRMAKRFEIVIILVAHRRKNRFSSDANDEVSGSGDITNRVDVVISYDRGKPDDVPPDERLLIVSKNRLLGKLNFDGIRLKYDELSKRIYGEGDDLHKAYSWEKDEQGFIMLSDDESTPFGNEDD